MIKGKVAALIDNRTLVLNIGQTSGVTKGMRFMIYDAKGKEIRDPDTNKALGMLRLKKVPVEVTEVATDYSTAETYRYEEKNEGGTGLAMSAYLTPPKYVKKYETFEIDENAKKQIALEKSLVKPGDLAEQIN